MGPTSSGREFQSGMTMEFEARGLVDDTHAASAQPLDDAVVRDGLADHQKMLGFRALCYGCGIL